MEQTHLKYHLEFQQVLITLATRFINLPIEQMDDTIIQALREIVLFLGAARSSINRLSTDLTSFEALFAWQRPDLTLEFPSIAPIPDASMLLPHLARGGTITVPDMHAAPESELRQLLLSFHLKALNVIPIFDRGQLFGFVSISWSEAQQLDPAIVHLLKVVGEIFLNAMERRRNEDRIQKLNEELEQRVAERTAELVQANAQLQHEIHERQQVEIALRQSESQLRVILETSPIAMVVIDDSYNLLYVNPVAASMFGNNTHIPSVDLATNFYVDPEDQINIRQLLRTERGVKGFELRYRTVDGNIHIGMLSIQALQFSGQSAWLAEIVDITELKRAQEAEHEQRTLAEALLDSAMALTSTLQLDEVVNHILSNLQRVVQHDLSNIMIIEGNEALVLGGRTYLGNSAEIGSVRRRVPLEGAYYPNLMMETRQPVLVGDITHDPKMVRLSKDGFAIKSFLGLPITVGQEVIGFINLGNCQADFFTQNHINYLQIFALQAGIAIQNAHLYKHAETIAALQERQRLARELHDSVSQTLFSANTIADALPQMMEKNPHKVHNYVQELQQLTHGAMAEMRSLLIELRPEALTRTELSVLLGQLCTVFTGKTQIEVEKRLNYKALLPASSQIVFYRVAQEALNNISKHAQAKRVSLDFQRTHGFIELRIKDDGRGFDVDSVAADHFGLSIMRERAKEIQAELLIDSHIAQGTEVILRSPL